MQAHATPLAADLESPDTDRRAAAAATPQATAAVPQPIDAELLKLVGGAGTLYPLPVNRW